MLFFDAGGAAPGPWTVARKRWRRLTGSMPRIRKTRRWQSRTKPSPTMMSQHWPNCLHRATAPRECRLGSNGSMDPAPSAVGHATVRGEWTPPRQQWVVCSCQRVPRRARWHLEDGMTWKCNLIKVSMKKSFSLSAKKEQQGSPAQNDGVGDRPAQAPKGAARLTSTGRRIRERCPAQAGERRARHRGAKKRYRSTRRTLKRRKDPPQAHLGAPTPDSVAQSHKLKRQCLSKGLPS